MERRQAIKNALILLGGSLLLPDVLKAWEFPRIENQSFVWTESENELLVALTEIIIPKTDTPGAREAGVAAFILKFVADCEAKEKQILFKTGLETVESRAKSQFNKSFLDCKPDEQIAIVKRMNAEATDGTRLKNDSFFYMLKHLTFVGYFTSEIGATQALRYEAVPGRYDGNYPYKKGDKAFY